MTMVHVLLPVLFIAFTSVKIAADDVPTLTLSSGGKIPVVGYGTWHAKGDELEKAIEVALETGYRHIDTATVYGNEGVIGAVLKRWFDSGKISRKDIFITTKLPSVGNRAESVSKHLNKSLSLLQLDYVDLYLIHFPVGFRDNGKDIYPYKDNGDIDLDLNTDHISLWKELERQKDAGLVKSIGLSNFNESQIERIIKNARIKPSNLQVELHAYFQQKPLVEFCKKHNIVVTAYSPLGNPGLKAFYEALGEKIELPNVLGNPVVKTIAANHNKTTAQILLRHAVQKGLVVIPKSTDAGRIKQNIDIFNFQLDDKEITELNNIDANNRILDFIRDFKGLTKHPEYPFRKP